MESNNIADIFSAFKKLKIVVIGDVMIDKYLHGIVNRLSPEAPVPVVDITHKSERPGGAANVAFNCAALGAQVTIASVIGADQVGISLLKQLQNDGIDTSLMLQSKDRITTQKTRVLNGDKHALRFDEEITEDLATADEHKFIDLVMRYLQIQKPQLVIFEDYNKGVLKENVIDRILDHCKHIGIITAVDPKKKNFFKYKGVDIFKPNLKEIKEALLVNSSEPADINNIELWVNELDEVIHAKNIMVTLSENGVFYLDEQKKGNHYPAFDRKIKDVSGAGDTVISVAAMVWAITKNAHLMALWSNIAGGLVCEQVGVVPINEIQLKNDIISYSENVIYK